jgi:hypothetical protein
MDAIPIMGVHLGPDHIDTVGTAEPSEAAFSDRSLAGNASIHTGDDETMEGKVGATPRLACCSMCLLACRAAHREESCLRRRVSS